MLNLNTQPQPRDGILAKLWSHVEDHLNDPQFDTSELLKLCAMSRSTLHRTLKAKVKLSATGFVRYVRLMKARQMLLETPELNISEIAIAVGFNSLSYFSRRFTELFGISPTQFRLEQQGESQRMEHF